jgi:regulatory protein
MEKALSLAYHFLSFRPRTIVEVEMYLEKKALKYLFTAEEIQSVIELLKDQGFLNDLDFIHSFVSSRNSLKPKSKRVLEMELKRLGASQSDIDTFFITNPTDEDDLVQKALKTKVKSLLLISDGKKRFIKAISFLQRRGFSYELAKKAYLQLMSRKSII